MMAAQHRSFSKEIIRFQNEKTFEKLLQLTPADIETLMEIAPKNRLPMFLAGLKDQIANSETDLKQAIMSVIRGME